MKKYLLFIFLHVFTCSIAQGDSILVAKVEGIKNLFNNYNYKGITFQDTALTFLRLISKIENTATFPDRSVYLEKRAEQLRTDLGVNITGSYIENFNLDPIVDLEENISYRRRVQLGMEWSVLDAGYFENQVRAKILEDRIVRERLNNKLSKESQYYLKRFDQTVFLFNGLKLNLLKERLGSLEKEYRLIRDLVILRKLKKEQLIKIEIQLSGVERLITVYQSYNDYLAVDNELNLPITENLPLIDLNYKVIFKNLGLQADSLLSEFEYEEYFKWYHQIGLRPFMRYNYYDIITANEDRSYLSAGINLRVPLRFDTQLNNEVELEKWKYENERLTDNRASVHEEVLNATYDFRFQLKRFVEQYQRRRLIKERLRISKVKMRLSYTTGDPLEGLELYDALVKSDIELIETLQILYLKALKIQTKIPGVAIDEIVKGKTVQTLFEVSKEKKRSVYVWSKTFTQFSSPFLAEYMIYNEFRKAVVAVELNDTLQEKKNFMKYASENGEVYFMFGNNQFFYEKNISTYLDKVLNGYDAINPSGIHLDIEPHTFDEWDKNRAVLLDQYLSLVTEVSNYCKGKGLKLEISVPKHYDQVIMEQLFDKVDQVYFMCYENVGTEFLVRKLKYYAQNYSDKLVISLRTEDFQNRLEMEDKIELLQEELGVNAFAYHDLRRMINFDSVQQK